MKLLCKHFGCRFYHKAFLTGYRTYTHRCIRCLRPMTKVEKITSSLYTRGSLVRI